LEEGLEMSRGRLISLLHHLQHRLGRSSGEALSDADLLARFVGQRDEAAFELLVWRHQHMVLGVCRRLLRDEHEAEDAFQAAFLILARKAASIGRGEAVAGWLYQVAYRCALRMRARVSRQRQGIGPIDPYGVCKPDPALAAVEVNDLHAALAEEVQRLPARYRAAVVLCYLEGKSYQQAASELGCPAGTLSARLHQARRRLSSRLRARGIPAGATVLTTLAGLNETEAARLASLALQAARRGVSGRALEVGTAVMQAMSAGRQKVLAAVVLFGSLLGMTGWTVLHALPQPPQQDDPAGRRDAPREQGKTARWQEWARLQSAAGRALLAWAPDGSALATVDSEDRLRVWDTSSWRPRWEYRCRPRYGSHLSFVTPFSPDGRLLAPVGSVAEADRPDQRKAELTLLDAANGQERARLPGMTLHYSPERTTLVTWHADHLTLWDARTFCKQRELKANAPLTGFVAAFSLDGSLLCVPTRDGRCRLWETATGKERMRPEGFLPELSPDGTTLLTVLPGGIVKLWDTASGRERATIRREGRAGCYGTFSHDGKQVLLRAWVGLRADGLPARPGPSQRKIRIRPIDVCLYDAHTGKEQQRLPGDAHYDVLAFLSPDGRTVAYSRLEADENEREEVVLWDVKSGRQRTVLRTPEGVRPLRFSPDGAALLTADGFVKNLRLWDVGSGRRLVDLPASVEHVHFSADGQWLAGLPQFLTPQPNAGDIRIFHRSMQTPAPPVVREDAVKPYEPPPSPSPPPVQSAARRAIEAVRKEAQQYDQQIQAKLQAARTDAERDRLGRERTEAYLRFAARALAAARDFTTDAAALEALEFVLRTTGGGDEGQTGKLRDEALRLVLRDHRGAPGLTPLLHAMSYQYADSADKALAEIAEHSPDRIVRGRAAYLLARGLAEKSEAARLLRVLPELLDDPALADRRPRLKRWQGINPDQTARRAEEWYARVRDSYTDVPASDGQKETLGESAERGLFALRKLAIGKVAPDIEGEDLDGKRFHLRDYRGKVVVLLFCGHWCGPCRGMHPQIQQLVERHTGKPFALLEVNSDEDLEAVRRTMRKEKRTWRCWFDGGRDGPIARRWGIHSWPTIFILDAEGVIRFKELRGPMLNRVADRLVTETGAGSPRP
jgi:RNA polymerase sigma factor (sigma-70 family)